MPVPRLDNRALARRVGREFRAGEVVALGPGLPATIPAELPQSLGVTVLSDSGALGYGYRRSDQGPNTRLVDSGGQPVSLLPGGAVLSVVDAAAMARGAHVDVAVIQPAQVNARGDFSHWTTAATAGIFAPGSAVDLASGARRVIAMMPHTDEDGRSNIVADCALPVDGAGCIRLKIGRAHV